MTEARRGRWAFTLASAAVLCGFALVPAAFLVPVYGTAGSSGADSSGATLIAVNGLKPSLMIVVVLPAVLAVIAWVALHRVCASGAARGRSVATLAIVSLAALTVLTGFSVGVEVLPVLVLLAIARRLTPSGASG
jgi:hypothetical protein